MIPVGDTVASLVDAGTGLEVSETWYARFYRHNRQAGRRGGWTVWTVWTSTVGGCQPTAWHAITVRSGQVCRGGGGAQVERDCDSRGCRPPGSVRRLCSSRMNTVHCAISHACSWHPSAHTRLLP